MCVSFWLRARHIEIRRFVRYCWRKGFLFCFCVNVVSERVCGSKIKWLLDETIRESTHNTNYNTKRWFWLQDKSVAPKFPVNGHSQWNKCELVVVFGTQHCTLGQSAANAFPWTAVSRKYGSKHKYMWIGMTSTRYWLKRQSSYQICLWFGIKFWWLWSSSLQSRLNHQNISSQWARRMDNATVICSCNCIGHSIFIAIKCFACDKSDQNRKRQIENQKNCNSSTGTSH